MSLKQKAKEPSLPKEASPRKRIIVPYIVKSNIEAVEYILQHPEEWGSGTKEDWERELVKLKKILQEGFE